MTEERYEAGYRSVGAGQGTIWIMMISVSIGYMFLAFVMSASCFYGPQVVVAQQQVPFQRFPDAEDPAHQHIKHSPVAELDAMWRKAFVGKVYTLLALQILVTLVIVGGMMGLGGYNFYVWSFTAGAWTRMFSMLGTFVVLISLFCFKQSYPGNLILLFVFTAFMSYTIGIICTAYAANGLAVLVVEAFAITSLIFVALTAFTMLSGIDFSFLGLVLPVLLFTLIIWGFFAMFAFPSFVFSQVYALAGTLIFSLYVIFDTYMITTYLSYDDYVLGAINLYLDFVNLFLFILQLLTGMRRD